MGFRRVISSCLLLTAVVAVGHAQLATTPLTGDITVRLDQPLDMSSSRPNQLVMATVGDIEQSRCTGE